MSNVRLPLLNEIVNTAAVTPAVSEVRADGEREALHDGAEAEGQRVPPQMQVGDLAREAGKTVRAIHLYEQMELLKPAGRSKGRYRLYGPEALVRIRWIGKLQDLGFSLTDIKAIVKDVEAKGRGGSAPSAMVKVREVYERKLDDTRAQIERLRTLEREILASLDYLETCKSACEPGRLLEECPSCSHHDRQQQVPDLVAGFRS
ncbi:MAG TPA: MerR family transcriptional regulator [Labilithrix sp.]|nr:MerR family transcriptional regulator [Labilithrix sp.]